MLIVEHNLSVVAELSDIITVLARGSMLAEGPYSEISENAAVREAYIGKRDHEWAGRDILRVSNLHAHYGESHILQGVDFVVRRGELVTLLGRNGAGRSTTLKAILGMVGRRTGSIVVKGEETIALPTYRIARLGIGYCPEERGIFGSLSANENLLLPPVGPSAMSIDEIYQMFPNLAERQTSSGTQLSGGEQQMLALARILRTGVDILLLDEITEGLAPVIVNALEDAIRTLKQRGLHDCPCRAKFWVHPGIADRHYVIERAASCIPLSTPISKSETPRLQRLLGL